MLSPNFRLSGGSLGYWTACIILSATVRSPTVTIGTSQRGGDELLTSPSQGILFKWCNFAPVKVTQKKISDFQSMKILHAPFEAWKHLSHIFLCFSQLHLEKQWWIMTMVAQCYKASRERSHACGVIWWHYVATWIFEHSQLIALTAMGYHKILASHLLRLKRLNARPVFEVYIEWCPIKVHMNYVWET